MNTDEGKVQQFIYKLGRIVDDPQTNGIIRWGKNGDTFTILDGHKFTKFILPKYYKHGNMNSFIRQLNMYGFRKIPKLDGGSLNDMQENLEFGNPMFRRGKQHLFENIKRKNVNFGSRSQQSLYTRQPIDQSIYIGDIQKQMSDITHQLKMLQATVEPLQQKNDLLYRQITFMNHKQLKQEELIKKLMNVILTVLTPTKMARNARCLPAGQNQNHPAALRYGSMMEGPVIHEVTDGIMHGTSSFDLGSPEFSQARITDVTSPQQNSPLDTSPPGPSLASPLRAQESKFVAKLIPQLETEIKQESFDNSFMGGPSREAFNASNTSASSNSRELSLPNKSTKVLSLPNKGYHFKLSSSGKSLTPVNQIIQTKRFTLPQSPQIVKSNGDDLLQTSTPKRQPISKPTNRPEIQPKPIISQIRNSGVQKPKYILPRNQIKGQILRSLNSNGIMKPTTALKPSSLPQISKQKIKMSPANGNAPMQINKTIIVNETPSRPSSNPVPEFRVVKNPNTGILLPEEDFSQESQPKRNHAPNNTFGIRNNPVTGSAKNLSLTPQGSKYLSLPSTSENIPLGIQGSNRNGSLDFQASNLAPNFSTPSQTATSSSVSLVQSSPKKPFDFIDSASEYVDNIKESIENGHLQLDPIMANIGQDYSLGDIDLDVLTNLSNFNNDPNEDYKKVSLMKSPAFDFDSLLSPSPIDSSPINDHSSMIDSSPLRPSSFEMAPLDLEELNTPEVDKSEDEDYSIGNWNNMSKVSSNWIG